MIRYAQIGQTKIATHDITFPIGIGFNIFQNEETYVASKGLSISVVREIKGRDNVKFVAIRI